MKNLMMMKCRACGRIKKFEKWEFFANLHKDEHQKLMILMLNGIIDWNITLCPECEKIAKPKT